MRTDRGQAHTLEGVVAALLLLASLLFALQVTTVTPLSASTSSQHIENQQRAIGSGLLSTASEQGDLESALLAWNASSGRFRNSGFNPGYSTGPPNDFGRLMNRSLRQHGIAYDITLTFATSQTGQTSTREYVDQGYPSDNAVTVTRTVVLTDGMALRNQTGASSASTLAGSDYFASDVAPDSPLYNVVSVEVTIWRI